MNNSRINRLASIFVTTLIAILFSGTPVMGEWISQEIGTNILAPSFAISNSGRQGIAYFSVADSAYKYAYFDGSSWIKTSVDTLGTGGGYKLYTSIAYDKNGNPGIAYGKDCGLVYAYHNGNSWLYTKLEGSGWGDLFHHGCSLAFDKDGLPGIAYVMYKVVYDQLGRYGFQYWLRYAHFNGNSWDIDTISCDEEGKSGPGSPSLAFEASGNPAIAYVWGTLASGIWEYKVIYAKYNGQSWDKISIYSSDAQLNSHPVSLALDPSGNPGITYSDHYCGYAHFNGTSWDLSTIDNQGFGYSSLAFDKSGYPSIAYQSYSLYGWTRFKYARFNGISWQTEYVGMGGDGISLVFDSDNSPIMVHKKVYVTSGDADRIPGYLVHTTLVKPNLAPIADAGPDQTVSECALVTLDGSLSKDPEGKPLTYSWRQTVGSPVNLNLADPTHPTFKALETAIGDTRIEFELVVHDNVKSSSPDVVSIYINNSSAPVLLNEDFADGQADGWQVGAEPNTTWLVENGEYSVQKPLNPITDAGKATTGNPAWIDYSFTVDVKHISGWADTWLYYRMHDSGTYYGLVVAQGDHDLMFQKVVNGSIQYSTRINDVFQIPFNTWFSVKFEVKESKINCYLNDVLQISYSDASPLVGGKVGFSLPSGTHAHFDNVRIIGTNMPPVADAGSDQVANIGDSISLSALNSFDPNGCIVSYQWEQIEGPTVTLSDPSDPTPNFIAPIVGIGGATLQFKATVIDRGGLSSFDTCFVTVKCVNQPPIAEAGNYQPVSEGEAITLNGSSSSDPEGMIADFYWQQLSGPTVNLDDPHSSTPAFVAPDVSTEGGVLEFMLTVTDSMGLKAQDTCIINIAWANAPPLAEAGTYPDVYEGNAVFLDGRNSYDPDDGIVAYEWKYLSGPAGVTLSDRFNPTPSFTAPNVGYGGGTLVFELIVTDNGGLKSSDKCSIQVLWLNTKSVVDAGPNVSVASDSQNTIVLSGTATDTDGDSLKYRWLEGEKELSSWLAVGEGGEVTLPLVDISPFSIGEHTIVLEVNDGYENARDETILTISNSAPVAAPAGEGIFQIKEPINLSGQVADYDGDILSYAWLEGTIHIFEGTIQSLPGGYPVDLPIQNVSGLSLGVHTLTLQVSDGINGVVSRGIQVSIIDTVCPTLAPIANQTILWPANHQMVTIVILSNAVDNSGNHVHLDVVVASNEPQDGLGDGDVSPDWTQPVVQEDTGTVTLTLRAERSGSGKGRQYTVTIKGTDESGNTGTANVKIVVPHDRGK